MLSLAHVVYLLSDKFSCLGGWGFALTGIFLGSLNGLALGHGLSPDSNSSLSMGFLKK
jgi:hypothetical protein